MNETFLTQQIGRMDGYSWVKLPDKIREITLNVGLNQMKDKNNPVSWISRNSASNTVSNTSGQQVSLLFLSKKNREIRRSEEEMHSKASKA